MNAVITVAPTGPIATRAENPYLPVTPEEIADQVVRAHSEGAAVAHLHFRDEKERPTADLDIARRTVDLIRGRCDILIQLSTGVGLGVPFEARAALVELAPQMATLNPCSMTFGSTEFSNPPEDVRRLAARMQELGVKPELEVYDTGHLDFAMSLNGEGLLNKPLQFSVILGVKGGMAATAANLYLMASRIPDDAIWQVIAVGRANLELTAIGLALGANARCGLEDSLFLRKGELARGNVPLVHRTAEVVRALDRSVATSAETGTLLGL